MQSNVEFGVQFYKNKKNTLTAIKPDNAFGSVTRSYKVSQSSCPDPP